MNELVLDGGKTPGAKPDDPRLGVYVLTEFVFCPRAGLCAYESQDWQFEEEQPRPSNYVPDYSLEDIERALAQVLNEVGKLALLILLSFAVGVVLTRYVHRHAAYLAIAAIIWFGFFVVLKLRVAWILVRRRQLADTASAREPDISAQTNQPVQWWDLIKAGFASKPCPSHFVHEDWKFGGKPHRILVRGSMRIPVWHLRSETAPKTVQYQHQIRMAAYCHLVEVCEGAESPFGIVLFGDSYEGMAIPNSAQNRKAFHEELQKARQAIQAVQGNKEPLPPQNDQVCRGCPFGEPVLESQGVTFIRHTHSLPVLVVIDSEGKTCHSHCGDRFRWLPPHAEKESRGLRLLG